MKEMSLRRLELDGVDGTLGRQEGTHLELVDNLAPMLMVKAQVVMKCDTAQMCIVSFTSILILISQEMLLRKSITTSERQLYCPTTCSS